MLIGITGKSGSGKDTIARLLVERADFVRIAFADSIKAGIKALFNIPDFYFLDENKEKIMPGLDKSVRDLVKSLSEDWAKPWLGNNIWVNIAERQISVLTGEGKNVVVSDVRFNQEAEMIAKRYGHILEVVRPCLDTSGSKYNHVSERGIDDFYVCGRFVNDEVTNHGDLNEELWSKLKSFYPDGIGDKCRYHGGNHSCFISHRQLDF